MKRHATKTYMGRPACAGSGAPNGDDPCPVCGRSGFSPTALGKVNTHIHNDDLASRQSISWKAQKNISHARGVAAARKNQTTFTTEQHNAIKAFADDNSKETYTAMLDTGVEAGHGSNGYIGYARKQGWTI